MPSPLRRLLALLVVAAAVVLSAPVAAQATTGRALTSAPCSQSIAQAWAGSDAVFEGQVLRRVGSGATATDGSSASTGTARAGADRWTTYLVTVRKYWKMPDASVKQVQVQVRRIDPVMGTSKSNRYVFFADASGRQFVAPLCGGVRRANDKFVKRLDDYYDSLGRPTQQQPGAAAPTFTKVADADPTSLARLAAPGAALVLVGLLGLFVVRRVSSAA